MSEGEGSDEVMLKQFLSVYRIKLNPSTVSGISPAEFMFARMIKYFLNKLLPERQARTSRNNNINRYFKPGDKVFF